MRFTRPSRRAWLVIVVLVVVGGFLVHRHTSAGKSYSAYFSSTTGLYAGNQVKVLGVQVGSVTKVTEELTRVRVDFTVDSAQRIPLDAEAVIIAPSLVSGRFVQLTPAYTGGPALAEGAVIAESHTAVPVEFDEVKQEVTRLAQALGPTSQNKDGALHDLIEVASQNLNAGTAQDLRSSLHGMSEAVATISSSKDDLFATINGVNSFVTNLVQNEANLRSFSSQLDAASNFLAADRGVIAQSVQTLQQALGDLTTFVTNNRQQVATSIDKVATLASTLAEEKTQIANALHRAPTVMANYYNIQDPYHGGVIGRPVLNYFNNVAQFTCGLVLGVGGTSANCSQALQSMLQALHLPLSLPGSPGNSVLNPGVTNPSSAALSSGSGLSGLLTGLTSTLDGGQQTPGLLSQLLGGTP